MIKRIKASSIIWILCALGAFSLPYFYNGVFFERGHEIVDLILSCVFVVSVIFIGIRAILKRKTPVGGEETVGRGLFWFKPNRYDIAFGIFVLCYIQATFHAASLSLAIGGATDVLGFIVPYVLLRSRLQSGLASVWVLSGLALTSVAVNVIGMANGWGQFNLPSAISTTQGIQIASVFQYHNAYASFTAALALGLLVYVGIGTGIKKTIQAILIGIASLNVVGLVLSGSRGALAMWLVVLLVTMIGLRVENGTNQLRIRFLSNFYIAMISAGIGYILIHKGISHAHALYGWLGIIISLILPFVLQTIFHRIVANFETWRHSFLTLILLGIIGSAGIGAANLHSLIHKLASYQVHQLSVVQRFIFWKDGLKIVGLNPLLGSGSGAWQAMFMRVESYPYYSTRVHSYFIDILMEVGIIGLCALLFSMWPMIRSVIWPKHVLNNGLEEFSSNGVGHDAASRRALGVIGFMIFVHSLMDWDMSFLFLELVFIIGLASSTTLHEAKNAHHSRITQVKNWTKSYYFCGSIVGVLSLISGYISLQSIRAENIVNSASKLTLPTNTTQLDLLNQAHNLNPMNPAYLVDMANLTMKGLQPLNQSTIGQQTALNFYKQAANIDVYNPQTLGNGARIAYGLGQYQAAAEMATKAFYNAPFLQDYITLALNGNALYGLSNARQNPAVAQEAFHQVQSLYSDYLHNLNIVRNLPSYLPPLDPYQLGDFAYDSVAASYLGTHDPQTAITIATKVEDSKDTHTAATAKLIILIGKNQLGQGVSGEQIQQFITNNPSVSRSASYLMALR